MQKNGHMHEGSVNSHPMSWNFYEEVVHVTFNKLSCHHNLRAIKELLEATVCEGVYHVFRVSEVYIREKGTGHLLIKSLKENISLVQEIKASKILC